MAMADKPDSRQVAGFGPTFFNLCNVTLGAGILSYPVRARALSLRTTARSTTSTVPPRLVVVLLVVPPTTGVSCVGARPLTRSSRTDRVFPRWMDRFDDLLRQHRCDLLLLQPRAGSVRGTYGRRD
jgi:hypothetical protein